MSLPGPIRRIAKQSLTAALPTSRLALRGHGRRPEFAITFDDGPTPSLTPRILSTLQSYSVRATFFLTAECAEQYPDLVRYIVEEGHEIGSHSYSHPHFEDLSLREAAHEIRRAKDVLSGISGQECRLFRPPFGRLLPQTLLPAWWYGLSIVLWSVDLKDYAAVDVAAIQHAAAAHSFHHGDIILYHDKRDVAVEALPFVIESARDGGRRGVTVSNLLWPRS